MTLIEAAWKEAHHWKTLKIEQKPNVALEFFRVISWLSMLAFFILGVLALLTRNDDFGLWATFSVLTWIISGAVVLRAKRSQFLTRL